MKEQFGVIHADMFFFPHQFFTLGDDSAIMTQRSQSDIQLCVR